MPGEKFTLMQYSVNSASSRQTILSYPKSSVLLSGSVAKLGI